jgi:hypothetical protein
MSAVQNWRIVNDPLSISFAMNRRKVIMKLKSHTLALLAAGILVGTSQPVTAKTKVKAQVSDETKVNPKPKTDVATATISNKDFGLGIGVLTFGPPVLGLELTYTYHTRITFALESGAFSLSLPETKVNSKFAAVHLRYSFSEGKPFFIGLGYAQQTATIASRTDATIAVENPEAGATDAVTESFTVTVKLVQPLVIPHVGWMWIWENGAALTLGLGLQVPVGTKISVSDDAKDDGLLGEEKITEAQKEKTDQVKKFLDVPLPYLALKFS